VDRNDPFVRAFALIAFVGIVAGATALAYGAIGTQDIPVDLDPVVERRTTGPGLDVAFPVTVRSTTDTGLPLNLSVSAPRGLTAEAPPTIRAPADGGSGFWVNVSVAEDPPLGKRAVELKVSTSDGTRVLALPVTVEDTSDVVDRGETARVQYVGRYPNGSVFATNVEAIDKSSMPKADRYSSPNYDPLPVPTNPEASFIPGFKDGVVGVGVGHDVTLDLSPSEAYGNTTERVTEPRDENITRIINERRLFNVSRSNLQQQGLINATSEEGDTIDVGQPPQVRTYRITFLNDTVVELLLDVEEGDRQTHHTQWPNSSVAVDVNETRVRYRVDPPHEAGGEAFTWHERWPNATTVRRIGDENITLRHSPEVGTTYNRTVSQTEVEHTVVELTEDSIVATRPNPSPLAGQPLVFDVSIIEAQSG
jgi:FKBP-type peptidyl-prolyl cis-trans isomerase 2